MQLIVESTIVILEFAAATLTAFRPVIVESVIVTTASGAVPATLTA